MLLVIRAQQRTYFGLRFKILAIFRRNSALTYDIDIVLYEHFWSYLGIEIFHVTESLHS